MSGAVQTWSRKLYKHDTALMKAAAKGEAGKLGEQLAGGQADVNGSKRDGRTALHAAAAAGHASCVAALLAAGADGRMLATGRAGGRQTPAQFAAQGLANAAVGPGGSQHAPRAHATSHSSGSLAHQCCLA